jgi:hypothetical protein
LNEKKETKSLEVDNTKEVKRKIIKQKGENKHCYVWISFKPPKYEFPSQLPIYKLKREYHKQIVGWKEKELKWNENGGKYV